MSLSLSLSFINSFLFLPLPHCGSSVSMPLPAVARLMRNSLIDSHAQVRPACSPANSNDATSTNSSTNSSTNAQSDRNPQTYGYYNSFHTHALPADNSSPPSYSCAVSPAATARLNATAQAEADAAFEPLPSYTCSVEIEGVVGLKTELVTPFQASADRQWHDVYAVLCGTQLNIHHVKTPSFLSKSKSPTPGRLTKSYTLQHAEIGLASDFKKTQLIPRSPFAHLVPSAARQKVFESDPHLFEPVREFVMRLRLETEQLLLCCQDQDGLLNWLDKMCAAADISPPLDDRAEPRIRSLPRRTRRQRQLDGMRIPSNLENLGSLAAGRRILAEQERIIRTLYPQLANSETGTESANSQQPADAQAAPEGEPAAAHSDPEAEDLDPADVRFPSSSRRPRSSIAAPITSSNRNPSAQNEGTPERRTSVASNNSTRDPKNAPRQTQSQSQSVRYRRRCAPILLASSPRVTDILYSDGKRMRLNPKDDTLVEFTQLPPRYDAHSFTQKPTPPKPASRVSSAPTRLNTAAAETTAQPAGPARPTPQRGASNDSLAYSFSFLDVDALAFGYDLATTSSAEQAERARLDSEADEIRSLHPTETISEPPSPTTATALTKMAKADPTRRLMRLGKVRSSSEEGRDMSVVTVGVGMLI